MTYCRSVKSEADLIDRSQIYKTTVISFMIQAPVYLANKAAKTFFKLTYCRSVKSGADLTDRRNIQKTTVISFMIQAPVY